MPALKRAFAKLFLIAAAGLLALPIATYWFAAYAEAGLTRQLSAAVDARTPGGGSAMTVGALCDGAYPQYERLRENICETGGEVWQFHTVRAATVYTMLLGGATLLLTVALALVAFFVPRLQVRMFTAGWWSLRAISALEITLQGALLVWLSFWVTAYFTQHYYVKLILIAGVLAAGGVFAALAAIFRRAPEDDAIAGEPIEEAQAPALWARVKQLCASLGTEPPANLIGGIDDNFFVTQVPLQLADRRLSGRSLFVSLPLLRAIERDEADAVLAHEMAHFSGGDTAESARLGPKLNAYAHYMQALEHNLVTKLAFYVMSLFRVAFELARSRQSRMREFAADAKAAALTSPGAISRALIRIAAYAQYRHTVERQLFAHSQQHEGSLNVAQRVAQGLAAFTQTDHFKTALASGNVPHPFDSHPPLQQRMQNVGAVIETGDFARIVASAPAQTWVDFIPDAGAIEARLWQRYEAHFASEHLKALAWRYEPANEAEREVVLKFFPDVAFALKKQQTLRITYAGIEAPEQRVAWDAIVAMQYKEGSFGTSDTLTLSHPDKTALGTRKQTKLKIAIKPADRARLKATINHYWGRHQAMRRNQRQAAPAAPASA